MTYEERVKHRELVERAARLREELGSGEETAPITRAEARELAALIEETLGEISPERWDRVMQTIVEEAARRAGVLSVAE
ncbi:MAG: hypothetical protein R3266_04935 [Gemmatimonadota bacterium]|nr:hypothetical protein [Gemmatimonadota bacterium]